MIASHYYEAYRRCFTPTAIASHPCILDGCSMLTKTLPILPIEVSLPEITLHITPVLLGWLNGELLLSMQSSGVIN